MPDAALPAARASLPLSHSVVRARIRALTANTSYIDLTTPRTVGQLFRAAFHLFAGWAWMFLLAAAIVLIPYGAVTAVVADTKHVSNSTELLVTLADVAIVNPFVAAVQMQVLLDLGSGQRPVVRDFFMRGLRVLPAVVAAGIIVGLPEILGLIYPPFLILGLLAAIRLAVAAPAAAAERVSWPDAIRRSFALTRGNAWRIFGLLLIQAVLTLMIAALVGQNAVTAAIVGIAVAVVAQAFFTLVIALLYFDLRAREPDLVAS